MLEEGKKSLAQIAEVRDPVDRVRDLMTLLEYVLLANYGGPKREESVDFLSRHQDKFSDYRAVDFARRIRNKLGHANIHGRPATRAQILDAEIALDQAIRDILDRSDCDKAVRHDALGKPREAPKKTFGSSPESETPPFVTLVPPGKATHANSPPSVANTPEVSSKPEVKRPQATIEQTLQDERNGESLSKNKPHSTSSRVAPPALPSPQISRDREVPAAVPPSNGVPSGPQEYANPPRKPPSATVETPQKFDAPAKPIKRFYRDIVELIRTCAHVILFVELSLAPIPFLASFFLDKPATSADPNWWEWASVWWIVFMALSGAIFKSFVLDWPPAKGDRQKTVYERFFLRHQSFGFLMAELGLIALIGGMVLRWIAMTTIFPAFALAVAWYCWEGNAEYGYELWKSWVVSVPFVVGLYLFVPGARQHPSEATVHHWVVLIYLFSGAVIAAPSIKRYFRPPVFAPKLPRDPIWDCIQRAVQR